MAGLLDAQTEEERIAQQRALMGYADDVSRQQAKQELMTALGNTWPAQLAKSAYQAVRAPGDVAYGLLDPRSDEAIKRSADLAGLMGTGGLPFAQRNALGTGGGKMVQPARESFDDLIAQAKQRLADRDQQAREFAATGSPVRLADQSGHKALVQPDMSRGEGWRVTMLDNAGPMGHREFDNAYDAFHAAMSDGYAPIAKPPGIRADNTATKSSLLTEPPKFPAATLSSSIETKYPGLKLDMSGGGDKPLVISRIELPKDMREQGIGTQVMREVIDYADKTGAQLALSPSSDFGGNKARLAEWYKSMGFVPNKGKTKDLSISEEMYRIPQIKREDIERGLL